MKFVDLHAQYLTIKGEVDAAIASVIEQSAFVRGPHVNQFEERFADLLGVENCISCANGTDALYIALRALNVRPGDEVITTAHSWISTSETITQAGGNVVFCDTEDDYFSIDPQLIEEKITAKTKGIIVVHLYGQPADMEPVQEIARRHGLWLIEDCAQAHLARYKGQLVGTFGDIATFSFYPGKNLGAMGDAGCVVTNRRDLAEFAALFSRHGGKNDHKIEGINSRMDGLQAAILNVKLRHLPKWTRSRQSLAQQYNQLFADIPFVRVPPIREGCEHVFHLYVIRTKCRNELRAALAEHDVPSAINYPKAPPFYPAYAHLDHQPSDFPIAHRHMGEILSLPMYPEMGEADVRRVTDCVNEFGSVVSV